ncbi:acetoacetate decarboxylase family protein [Methylocystis sp. JAN1]|uniref:acetoacetate decarboxylase family protein n=1 Tax=Methylocystis sp. JAN1 TaxID=3397211 RepID=UPI003FA1D57A
MYGTILTQAPASQVELSSGRRVGLPVRYLDWTAILAHFPAPASAVRRLLPSKTLAPVLIAPGTAILSVAAVEYRRIVGITPYNEVAIMVPVLHKPVFNIPALPLFFPRLFKSFGFFILNMPVNAEESRELGVKVWGYPRFLAEIEFDEIDNVRRCRVRLEGKDFLTLDVQQFPAKIQSVDFCIYTVKDGRLLRHRAETEGLYGLSPFPGGAALAFGDHPLAQALRGLGVGKKPIARVFGSAGASLLHEADRSFPL